MAGVLAVATHGEIGRLATLDLNAGDALVLVAVLVYAIYTVYLRYKPQMNWKSLIVVLSVAAALAAIPGVWWEWQNGSLIVPGSKGLLIALYTGIFPSIMSQIFFIKGVELIGANRAGIFINLIPIFGTGLAILILGEPLHAYHIWHWSWLSREFGWPNARQFDPRRHVRRIGHLGVPDMNQPMKVLTWFVLACAALATAPAKAEDAMIRFFTGKTEATGKFAAINGVRRSFDVKLRGHWNGKTLRLIEDFAYEDGVKNRKTWVMTKVRDGVYTGTREDVVGETTIRVSGNTARFNYLVDVEEGPGENIVRFYDTLRFAPDGRTMKNTAFVTKYGLPVARVRVDFIK